MHTAVHMHIKGEKPGDPPFDHEFKPRESDSITLNTGAVIDTGAPWKLP
jgi:hypothetical protein